MTSDVKYTLYPSLRMKISLHYCHIHQYPLTIIRKFALELALGEKDISLIRAAYRKSMKRHCTESFRTFFMIGPRQSNMASRSMGTAVPTIGHHYHDKKSMDTGLVPLVTPLMRVLTSVTQFEQSISGQVIMGLFINSVREKHDYGRDDHFTYGHVSPHTILTCPKYDKGYP